MPRRLTEIEHAEIRCGNMLIVPCQGQGGNHCGGRIRIPFTPTIDSAPEPRPAQTTEGVFVWTRVSGSSLDDITLSPSIDAFECGHFHVMGGSIVD